jgi:hypothetical protein
MRDGLYKTLQQGFSNAGIPWEACHREDRGDGVLILAPPDVPKALFAEALPSELARALRDHNRTHDVEDGIRLRMALHAGEINYDQHGVVGGSISHAFRLVDSRPLKSALAQSHGAVAVIVSDWFFEEVVRHSPGADPGAYRRARVTVKDASTTGWIALPDYPYPSADLALESRAADSPITTAVPVATQSTSLFHMCPRTRRSFASFAASLRVEVLMFGLTKIASGQGTAGRIEFGTRSAAAGFSSHVSPGTRLAGNGPICAKS